MFGQLFGGVLLLIATILTLCQWNPKFKLYVKFGVYYVFMSVSAVCVLFLSLFTPKDPSNFSYMKPPFKICRYLLGIHPVVKGEENFKHIKDKAFILVSNHQSSLDFLGVGTMIPHRCTFLAKRELLYAGPFGLACWLCGIIFIDRRSHDKAINTMVETAKTINKRKSVVWIFPEGHRNPGKEMLPFKSGAFHLAVQAQVPIVPVVFSSYASFYDKKRKRLDAGTYTITVLPPVYTDGMTEKDVPNLVTRVRDDMVKVYNETSV